MRCALPTCLTVVAAGGDERGGGRGGAVDAVAVQDDHAAFARGQVRDDRVARCGFGAAACVDDGLRARGGGGGLRRAGRSSAGEDQPGDDEQGELDGGDRGGDQRGGAPGADELELVDGVSTDA